MEALARSSARIVHSTWSRSPLRRNDWRTCPPCKAPSFSQGAVAALVAGGGARLQPMRTHRAERESKRKRRSVLEQAPAPERRAERKSPFGGAGPLFDQANLKDADGRIGRRKRHGEARVPPRTLLIRGPADESFEASRRAWRGREEPRHFYGRQKLEQRYRVGRVQVAQHDVASHERWERLAPAFQDPGGTRRKMHDAPRGASKVPGSRCS